MNVLSEGKCFLSHDLEAYCFELCQQNCHYFSYSWRNVYVLCSSWWYLYFILIFHTWHIWLTVKPSSFCIFTLLYFLIQAKPSPSCAQFPCLTTQPTDHHSQLIILWGRIIQVIQWRSIPIESECGPSFGTFELILWSPPCWY